MYDESGTCKSWPVDGAVSCVVGRTCIIKIVFQQRKVYLVTCRDVI